MKLPSELKEGEWIHLTFNHDSQGVIFCFEYGDLDMGVPQGDTEGFYLRFNNGLTPIDADKIYRNLIDNYGINESSIESYIK